MSIERGSGGGALFHREAVFEAALVVDESLLDIGIPLVAEALAGGFHGRGAGDGGLVVPKAVALQLQPPRPSAVLGRGEEAAPVELGGPLLAGIARLPAGGVGLEGVPPAS